MTTWTFDPSHSNIEFSVRHMMVTTVKGSFSGFEGTMTFDPANLSAAHVEGHVATATVNTRDEQRDTHLRSGDFFDAESHPRISFRSTRVEPTGETSAKVHGDLTIRGVARPVVFDAEFYGVGNSPFGDVRAGMQATTTVNREDFALTWNVALEAGGVLVGKDVKITLDLEAIRQGEAAPAV